MSLARPGQAYWFAYPEPTRAWCVLLALLGLTASLWLLRARDARQAGAVGAFWFSAIGFAASLALPGLSILFALPALFYAVGALVGLAWLPAIAIGAGLAALVATLVWAPTLYLVELALGFEMPFAIVLLMTLLGLTWIGAIVHAQAATPWRGGVLGLAAAALAMIVVSALAPASSAARPRPLNLVYFYDAAHGQARVLAGSARRALPPELADGFAFAPQIILPGDLQPSWAAPADVIPTPTPALEQVVQQENVLRARLRMNGAYRAVLRMPRSGAPTRVTVNGVEASFADTGPSELEVVNLACQGRACDGAELVLGFAEAPSPADWFLVGQYPGAANAPLGAALARRPASATPIQFGDGVLTLSPAAP